jgi:hypothetical protein
MIMLDHSWAGGDSANSNIPGRTRTRIKHAGAAFRMHLI